MPDRLADVPSFTTSGVTFACWVVDGGQRYVWRSTCGRYAAGRIGRHHWSRCDGRIAGAGFPSLKFAMVAAIAAQMEAA